jgi:hypothetical protein
MPLSFPSSPTVGQTSAQNGRTYVWSGYAWELTGNVAGHAASHASSGADAITPASIGAATSEHTHSSSSITDFATEAAKYGPVTSVNGQTGAVTVSGGGATEIYEYASWTNFPATGTAAALYIDKDRGRVFRWETNVYVEVGPVGGGDTSLWNYFLPPAPTSLTATAGNTQVSLSWTAPSVLSVLPITDYVVQYSTNGGSTWSNFSDGVSASASAAVTGLTNGTAYVFRVAGVNGVGQGAYSAASSSVTPTEGDPFFSSVALLLHADGTGSTFVDSSPTPKTVTASGNATQSATQSKWGGKSAYFDGGGYLTIPAIALGTGDFVLECWMYFNSISGTYTGIYDARPGSNGSQPTLIMNGSSIAWFTNAGFQITGIALSTGQWHHVAVARASGSTRMYVNGTQVGSTYSDSTNYSSSSAPIIGKLFDGYEMNGFIDDLRITVGSSRGYSGTTITVPTAAFPDA